LSILRHASFPKPLHSETMRGFGASPGTKYPAKLWLVIFFQPPKANEGSLILYVLRLLALFKKD